MKKLKLYSSVLVSTACIIALLLQPATAQFFRPRPRPSRQTSSQQEQFRPSKPDPTCVCDPLCQIYPESRLATCTRVPRSDCPCCEVCAALEGEPCDPAAAPCDVTRRLQCDPEQKVCKGKHLLATVAIVNCCRRRLDRFHSPAESFPQRINFIAIWWLKQRQSCELFT